MKALLDSSMLMVLRELLLHPTAQSVANLAQRTGLNVDGASDVIDRLVTLGCRFDSHPQAGVRLDRASIACWSDYLEQRHRDALGRRVIVYEQTASTQDAARQQATADACAAHGTIVLADHQTAGRGRLGSAWWSQPGACVLMSIVLGPPPAPIDRITLAAGLAIANVVELLGGPRAALHWPNDVYIHDRKLAGVLVERAGQATVLGIGINHHFDDSPPRVDAPRPPIDLHTAGIEVDRLRVLDVLLGQLDHTLHQITDTALAEQWLQRAGLIQHRVTALSDGQRLTGRVIDIDPARGLVVLPTETVYGVAAATHSDRGMQRLRQLKQRPASKPFSVHMADPRDASRYVDVDAHPQLDRLIRKTMPGPITIIAPVSDQVIADRLERLGIAPAAAHLLYHNNTIGLRCPDHPVAANVLGAIDTPIVASSANHAGRPETFDAQAAADAVGPQVDLVLDGGRCRYEKPSTVVRVTERGFEVMRDGVYDQRYLSKIMQRKLLFVCSGNTCRSPMAQAIAEHELARRLGVRPGDLAGKGWAVQSAGAFAIDGSPATPEAIGAVKRLGIDPPRHRSSALTPSMLNEAEAVFCMTQTHRQAVLAMAPQVEAKVHMLDPDGDIDDPIGAGDAVYDRCARRIARHIRQHLSNLSV